MFTLNNKRINIDAPHTTEDGVTYANLRDPCVRLALGVAELADPPQPADYSDKLYFRTEQDDAPYVVYTRKPDEMIAQGELAETNAKALSYLASTDWYVTRSVETGAVIPPDILFKRQAARDAIAHPSPAVPASGTV